MIKHILFLLFIVFIGNHCIAFSTTQKDSLFSITTEHRTFRDAERLNWGGTANRTVRTTIWCPAVLLKKKHSSKRMKCPLILVSHGAGGSAASMRWLGEFLSARGYIVAAADHKGDCSEEKNIGVLSMTDQNFWERPQDMKLILNGLLKDKAFNLYIDTSRIGAAGFSLGGYTAIALGGAIISLEALTESSPYTRNPNAISPAVRNSIDQYLGLIQTDSVLKTSLRHAEESFKESRVKGIFALSPAIGEAFTETGLRPVDVPVFIVAGEKDVIAPKETNAQLYASRIKDAFIEILPGEVGHVTNAADPQVQRNLETVQRLAFNFFESLWKQLQK
jgi:predicted dienelactone hydrolase